MEVPTALIIAGLFGVLLVVDLSLRRYKGRTGHGLTYFQCASKLFEFQIQVQPEGSGYRISISILHPLKSVDRETAERISTDGKLTASQPATLC